METYRGDWNVENRVTAESEFPLRVAFVTRRERNLSFLIFSIKFKSEAIFFFFFNFTIDTPLLLNQRIHGARKLAAIIAVERRSTGAWGKYGRTNGLPDTMDQRNIVGERGRSAANTRPIVPPEIITDYPDRF